MKSKQNLLQHVSLITNVGSSNIHHISKITVFEKVPKYFTFNDIFCNSSKITQLVLFATRKSDHEKSEPFEKMLFEIQLLSKI